MILRPLAPSPTPSVEPTHVLPARDMTPEEFWNGLADETEGMSSDELRAELAQFRPRRLRIVVQQARR